MTRYRKGADFERDVRAALTGNGWHATRSAGSHGSADIVALPPRNVVYKHAQPWLVQCKTDGKLPLLEQSVLLDAARRYGAIPILAWKRKGAAVYLDLRFDEEVIP